ncbi:MAG TPA: 4Fe-4S dicluster domain-containing protein [Candidatus Kryptonia bacterium]|nr:4Fe-4S dicluster domain-containing protein [Candidatus Kryptonia bacterium]
MPDSTERTTDDRAARALSIEPLSLSRRNFLTAVGVAAAGVLMGCSEEAREAFLQKNFLALSPEEVTARLKRLSEDYARRFGQPVQISALPAQPGVVFGYGLDLSRCIGCRRCVYACVKENNQSRDPQIQWIRVLEMEKERGVDFENANPYYNPDTVPDPDHFYVPVACQQCRHPQCTQVCPVGATWQEPDGIVVVDYDWCIGCRYCMAACPYGARHFNWGEPELPSAELNPNLHILGNRPRPRGVVEKCTFCIQRTRAGRYPACVEICPVGARKFGNLLDPASEISHILHEKRVFVLKAELKTEPKFYYFFGI